MFHLVYIFPSQDLWDDPFSGSLGSSFSVLLSPLLQAISVVLVKLAAWVVLYVQLGISECPVPARQTIKQNQPCVGLFGALTQQAPRSTVCVMIVFVFPIHWLFSKEALISETLRVRWGHLAQGCLQVRLQTWELNPAPFLLDVDHPNHCPALILFSVCLLWFSPRVIYLQVSMNDGLSFITSNVHVTTTECVSIRYANVM